MIRLLKETCSGASLPKFTDLIMKCIWRNVKVRSEKMCFTTDTNNNKILNV